MSNSDRRSGIVYPIHKLMMDFYITMCIYQVSVVIKICSCISGLSTGIKLVININTLTINGMFRFKPSQSAI